MHRFRAHNLTALIRAQSPLPFHPLPARTLSSLGNSRLPFAHTHRFKIMAAQSVTKGVHHVGLTVPDLAATRAFFETTLGYNVVGEKPDYPAVFLSDGTTMITLWQATDPATAVPFDRKNTVGLHHLALAVRDDATLDTLHTTLTTTDGVTVEFAPESLGGGASRHMMTTIPGGVRVEFIHWA